VCVVPDLESGAVEGDVATTTHTNVTSSTIAGAYAVMDAVRHAQRAGIQHATICVSGLQLEGHAAGTAKLSKKSQPQLKVILEEMRGLLQEHPGMKVVHMSEQDRNYRVMHRMKQLLLVGTQALPGAAALPAPPRT
jgi:hypothetical protein